ncbi:MAG: radical SAM protein [Nitrospinaceae bacterium]
MTLDEIIDHILMDRLDGAESGLSQASPRDPVLLEWVRRAASHPKPLAAFVADLPAHVAIHPSYTCNIGCRMCITGFQTQTSLYGDYKYFLPEQFQEVQPWVRSGTHVFFVGTGETMDSPYIFDYVASLEDKVTVVTTSGAPLTRGKIQRLIEAGLNILNISFDGRTSVGHGHGREAYIKNIWRKIDLIRQIRDELAVGHPVVGLHVTVNRENLADLESLFHDAWSRGIYDILLLPMTVSNDAGEVDPVLFEKSIGTDFAGCRDVLNTLMDRWSGRGMRLKVHEYPKLREANSACTYVDNVLQIHGAKDRPTICCGSIELPLAFAGVSPDAYWNSFPLRYFRFLHFTAPRKDLPRECQECWVMHPGIYYEACRNTLAGRPPARGIYPAYQRASLLQRQNRLDPARRGFEWVIRNHAPDELKGNAYFHLAEMEMRTDSTARASISGDVGSG